MTKEEYAIQLADSIEALLSEIIEDFAKEKADREEEESELDDHWMYDWFKDYAMNSSLNIPLECLVLEAVMWRDAKEGGVYEP